MGTTRFKGENASERLDFSGISDSDMIQLRHKPGTEEDADKGISKANLCSCPFGVSDTSASTAVKSAVLTDSNPDFNLVSGREVVVCFTTANTASSPSLNFAGSGSIPIYYPDGSAVGSWPADTWMHLKYFSVTIGNTSIQRWILLSSLPVDTVDSNNMHSVTSNAVEKAISFSTTEEEAGSYMGQQRYHKTKFYYVNIVADTQQIIDSNFEISINKIVNVDGFATNGSIWFKDLNIHFSQNNEFLIFPKFGGNTFAIVMDVYYVK